MVYALTLEKRKSPKRAVVWWLTILNLIITTAALASNQSSNTLERSNTSQTDFEDHIPIPHSTTAVAEGFGITKARLSCATTRYAHGVLGDTIEAGCLIVEDEQQDIYQLDLPDHQVFEDLIPRIADIDGDKRNDVVLVRSDSRLGAALSIYSIYKTNDGAEVRELAATPPIGTANRWLAPIGVADFNNDGALDIAYIQTPHIGGILKVWSIVDGGFKQLAQSRGFSNHSIGDTRVSTAKIADYNNDGVMDIALPDQRRQNTIWITLTPELSMISSKPYDLNHFD